MDPIDPYGMEPTPEERQAALIQVLKMRAAGQQPVAPGQGSLSGFDRAWGNQFVSSGDAGLTRLGALQIQQAGQADAQSQEAQQKTLTQILEAKRQASTEQHQRTQEELQRMQIGQGNFDFVKDGDGQFWKINKKDGSQERVGGLAPPKTTGGITDKDIAKQLETLRGHLAPDSTRKLIGQLEQNITRAEEFQNFVHDNTGKIIDLTPQQVREATTMFAQSVQNGGQPAIGQIEHLVPDTLKSRFANWKQLLTSAPEGADAQEFIKQLVGSTIKAKQVAEAEQRKIQLKWLGGTGRLRAAAKADYDAALKSNGIDPATIDENGLLIQQPPPQAAPGRAGQTQAGSFNLSGGPSPSAAAHPPGWDDAKEKRLQELLAAQEAKKLEASK